MKQREETVYNTRWYDQGSDNSKVTITLLQALEDATSGWTNVLSQTYTLGSTIFKDNAFTGCTYNETTKKFNCTTNSYILPSRTSRVRIISIQQAQSLGCTKTINFCPIWMSNYLYHSTNYGGTENKTGGDYGMNSAYWTMSANSTVNIAVWLIKFDRGLYFK